MQLLSFFKKDFIKNVLTLLTGSALSQVIVYVAMLWLTRLFSKELFGVYMLFSSCIFILKPLTSLQLELTVLLPKKEKEAANIFILSLLTLGLLNLFLFACILLFKEPILTFFEVKKLSYFIYFLPLSVFFYGCITTLSYWNNRLKSFKSIAQANITKASFLSFSQILTGTSSLNFLGLIPGMILGQITQIIVLFNTGYKTILKHKEQITIQNMLSLLKKYKDVPLFNTLINFSNTLSNEIPILMITKYFGLDFSGVYGLAIKVGRAPSGIFQESISQVFFNKASETYNNKENLNIIVKKTAWYLFKIALGIFSVLFIISFFLDIVFGEKWTDIGMYLRILIPWLFVMFITSPLTSLITVLNKQKIILVYDILLLISRFLAFYVGYVIFKSFIVSLSLFSAIGVLFNICILCYFLKISKTTHTKDVY